jgi:hypothetical protein
MPVEAWPRLCISRTQRKCYTFVTSIAIALLQPPVHTMGADRARRSMLSRGRLPEDRRRRRGFQLSASLHMDRSSGSYKKNNESPGTGENEGCPELL